MEESKMEISLYEALDTLVALVGLTAFKHEGQRAALQEAVDLAIAALQKARSDMQLGGAGSYVQSVPDRCDRIAWRNRCYNLGSLASADPALRDALADMLSGWKYIRKHHGDLYGVGWDRAQAAAEAALGAGKDK
jgi:hypothetical protein